MFAVEVQDAQGRVVPITDNAVTFKVTGAGKLIGVGNGDPTDQESDKGTVAQGVLRALHGDRAIHKDGRTASRSRPRRPGSPRRSATIAAKAVTLRPQVAVWEREGAAGRGVTGLWRPAQDGGTQIYVLRQDGKL